MDTQEILPQAVVEAVGKIHLRVANQYKSFAEYARDVFIPYITSELERSSRVDLVSDVYLKDSLKMTVREYRVTGARRRVLPNVKLPSNWKNFLRNDDNKDELFQFIANMSVSQDTDDKVILSTIHKSVVSSNPVVNLDGLQPCSHEEADTRILLHTMDAMNAGYKNAIIRTFDTDVVVLAVVYFQDLENIGNLWIAFGTGKDFRYIPVHEVARSIGPDMANGLGLPFLRSVRL